MKKNVKKAAKKVVMGVGVVTLASFAVNVVGGAVAAGVNMYKEGKEVDEIERNMMER